MATHKYNSIGTAFKATIKEDGVALDVSGVSTKAIDFKKPDGTVVSKTASFVTDGTDGQIEYVTVNGDLNVVGEWKFEGYVAGLGGWTGASDTHSFVVEARIRG